MVFGKGDLGRRQPRLPRDPLVECGGRHAIEGDLLLVEDQYLATTWDSRPLADVGDHHRVVPEFPQDIGEPGGTRRPLLIQGTQGIQLSPVEDEPAQHGLLRTVRAAG